MTSLRHRVDWQIVTVAASLLAIVLIMASYLSNRQHLAERRMHAQAVQDERQRRAICAILANIPGHIPPEIAAARRVFARQGHPDDCMPIARPQPAPTPAAKTASPTPAVTRTVVIIPPTRTARPAPTTTRRPTPRPSPSRTPTPRPTPSPSPSCMVPFCLP